MRFRSHQCWFPKEADSPRDYEDASAHSEKLGRAVIADGVSTAIFSRVWARLLTRSAVASPPDTKDSESLSAWLQPLQQEWRQVINYDVIARDWIRGPKVKSVGAQSTLLIVGIEPIGSDGEGNAQTDEYRLTAHAIGDCCLFLIRDGQRIVSFPMQDSAAYAAGPHVLSSILRNAEYVDKFVHLEERCRAGDLLVACTDAIGLWAMQEYEAGNSVDWMRYWENDTAWQSDILTLRARGPRDAGNRMRVDDCTLLLMQIVREEAVEGEPDSQPDRSDEPFSLINSETAPAETADAALVSAAGTTTECSAFDPIVVNEVLESLGATTRDLLEPQSALPDSATHPGLMPDTASVAWGEQAEAVGGAAGPALGGSTTSDEAPSSLAAEESHGVSPAPSEDNAGASSIETNREDIALPDHPAAETIRDEKW